MKAWSAAGRVTVSRLRGEDFSELIRIRRFRFYRGRAVVLH